MSSSIADPGLLEWRPCLGAILLVYSSMSALFYCITLVPLYRLSKKDNYNMFILFFSHGIASTFVLAEYLWLSVEIIFQQRLMISGMSTTLINRFFFQAAEVHLIIIAINRVHSVCAPITFTKFWTKSQYPTSRNGPPRFKQNARMHQYAYLGDNIKFQCKAIGRPQPKVHWYREGAYLNYSFTQAHPRFREKSMSLEIRRIEVGDKGNWMCRVWNNEGSTTRNFTLHIRIPEECLCQWASLSNQHHTPHQEDTSAETDPDVPLLLLPPLREDLNLSKYTTARCSKYANLEELARFPRPSTTLPTYQEWHSTSSTNPPPTTTTNHPPHPAAAILNMNAKLELASSIVKKSASIKAQHNQVYEEEDEDYDEDEEEMHNKNSNARHVTLVTPNPGAHVKAVMVEQGNSSHVKEAWMSTVKPWPQPPTKVAPYFRNVEELQGGMSHIAHVVLPAGRTLKLTCKAGGQPEPQVVWRKDNMEIHRDTESKTGSLFLVRKWSLELEDAAESDSGNYACEVFNSVGSILRKFRVDIQDRIRSRPILVPNVLLNQTIDVNNSVKFTCQVISDLVPHIVWIKLLKKNGFNFLDMSTVKKAKIYHNNSTNKYILEIKNVSLDDQGIYSCIAGNTLGMSMANATLIVNEFRPMTLPTENPYSWPISYTILLILSILLTLAFVTLTLLYFFFSKKFAKQSRVQNMDKMSVRKKVVITKKMQKDGDFSDLASTYAITVEPVFNANGSADLLPGAKLSSEEVTFYVVGEGAFGEVWRGTLRAKYIQEDEENAKLTPVAVKKLKMAAHEKELIILVSEMQIFKSIGEHPNILKLIGCCTGLGPLMVVLELCPHGNLRDFLRKHRPSEDDLPVCLSEEEEEVTEETIDSQNYLQPRAKVYQNVQGLTAEPALIKNLTLRDLVQFALEIARGMEFLASKKIIHRDLAARNVLVAENYSMKISDFGLSRNVIYHDYYRKRGAGRLPIKW
uniref:receptor protein-tyrosine kinase n=1 Tax=Ditylenchus dipsaci TaxID=166011 RepID=A0A915ET95_9BILA